MTLLPLRVLTTLLATAVLAIVTAAPAFAHGRGSEASNYSSRILQAPQIDGVTWEILGGDQYLAVTNTSGALLEVPGYEDTAVAGENGGEDPYLRIGPDGVEENQASRATYVNADRYAQPEGGTPSDVGPDQPPRWEQVSDEPSYAWHDHRIHWMAPSLPPVVTDPGQETLINTWSVVFSHDGEQYQLEGELRWIPGPSPFPWLGVALVLTLPALLGLRRAAGEGWVTALARPAAAVVGVVALANVTHLVDDFFALPLPAPDVAQSAIQTGLFIAIGLFGAVAGWRGRDGAFTALGIGAAALLVGQGLLYLPALTSSASTSVLPDWVTRLVVAASLAQAVPVGIVAVLGNRRLGRSAEETAPAEPVAATGD